MFCLKFLVLLNITEQKTITNFILWDCSKFHGQVEDSVSLVFIRLLIALVFHFKVLQIIRRHQLQIQATQPNQSFGQAAIHIAKYKKSVIMLLYILALFSVCYLPSAVFLQVMLFYQDFQHTTVVNILTKILSTLYYLSSALNPLLYCWRIRNLRVRVRQLSMRVFKQNVWNSHISPKGVFMAVSQGQRMLKKIFFQVFSFIIRLYLRALLFARFHGLVLFYFAVGVFLP